MPQTSNLTEYLRSKQQLVLFAIPVAIGLAHQFAMIFLNIRYIPFLHPPGNIYPWFKIPFIWWFLLFVASGALTWMLARGRIENTHGRFLSPYIYLVFLLILVEF